MNILHITDFHYSNENSLQINVVKSIVKTIEEQNLTINLVLFTGDLVQSGSKIESFYAANSALFCVLSEKLSIKKENIIFCQGNHDIDRDSIHPATKAYVDANIISNEDLDKLYQKKTDTMFKDCIKPSDNFITFLRESHKTKDNDIIQDLYSIHHRVINEKKIGIVCLNSAWLSAIDKQGKDDKGNLMIPRALLEEVKREMNKSKIDKKIVLLHHPLYFLKEFNCYEIENFIHNEFDLMFSGHVHKVSSVSRHSGTNGIFEHIAKASLSSKENLGCSLIEIDEIEENKIIVKEITYITDSEMCFLGESITHHIPCGEEKSRTIAFRKKIFDKIAIEKENANKLLLLKEDDEQNNFLSLYNHSILKKESSDGLESKTAPIISLDELVDNENNFLILGKDKCGKTSLLRRIQLECLINYSRNNRIPFYIDAKEFEPKIDSDFELEQYVRSYFEINREKTREILSSQNFILLIDNYSPHSGFANYLNKFLSDHLIKYIICSEYNISRSMDVLELGNTLYKKAYFHDLRRQEIIAYTEKRLKHNHNRENVQEKIIQLCKQLELPLNYWTISLLLLIHNKSSDSYFKNLFSVLDVCVDEIFGKKQLLIAHSRISFEQLKTICAELAKYLFNNFEKDVYSANAQTIVNFIDDFISNNDRISTKGIDVFNYFLTCGILKQKDDNDLYDFRLHGFFEYFLALEMTKDTTFKNDVLNDEVKYLAFKNQIEIYSGFKRDDIDFLMILYEKSKTKLDPILDKYNQDKDKELLLKVQTPEKIKEVCRNLSIERTLTAIEKAQIEDISDELQIDADVHAMAKFDTKKINSELIERYLSILSRVFRNSDEIIGNKEKIKELFNYIIDSYCDLGFYMIDEFSEFTQQEFKKEIGADINEFPELNLLQFISSFSPIIAQVSLFDGLGHFNLERMIKNEIQQLESNSDANQYKLFILYFLLLDIDINANNEFISIAMDKITIPVLKYMIVLKLNYYLAFKAGTNKKLQQELSNKIQKAQLSIDNKSDIGDIQRQIQEKRNHALENKNRI